jgi:membrane protein required for colicin V production
MIFDAVVLAAVILSSIVAFLRGFIRECLTIVGVVGGMAAAYFGGPLLTPLMRGWIGVDESLTGDEAQKLFDIVPLTLVADFCAYGFIFVIVVIFLSVISHFLAAGARKLGLGPIDRTLGVVFGIARAVLLLAILYLVPLFLFSEEDRKNWFADDSRSHVYIESLAEWIAEKIPNAPVEQKKEETTNILEKMDVLKSTNDAVNNIINQNKAPTEDNAQPGNGYKGEERGNLDQLFENTQE